MTYTDDYFMVAETKPIRKPFEYIRACVKKGRDGFYTGYAQTGHWSQSCKIRRIVPEIAMDDARKLAEELRRDSRPFDPD